MPTHLRRPTQFQYVFLILSALLLPTLAAATCQDVDPVEILPADEACPSWLRDGETMTAYTETELFELINGGAGLYLGYGWVATAIQNYIGEIEDPPVYATISLFNQGTLENAQALFEDPDSGTGEMIDGWGGSGLARIQVGFGLTQLDFQEECFFARVVVLSDEDDGVAAAYCLSLAIIDLLQGVVPTQSPTWGRMKALYR